MTKTDEQRQANFSMTEATINKTPGVCGGSACVGKSRIPVWLLVGYKQDGASDQKLLANYPTLTPEVLTVAWEYYQNNKLEIDAEIRRDKYA